MTSTSVGSDPEAGRTSGGLGGSSWVLVGIASIVGLLLALVTGTHIALAGVLIPLIVAAAWSAPRTLVLMLVIWTSELGLIRRISPGGSSSSFLGDPVLIVAPLVVICLILVVSGMGAFRNRTSLANVVLAFNFLAVFEVVNPKQGSILTGLGGLLFMLVPVMAFWVGRMLLDDDLAFQLVWMIAILGLLAGLYGLFQQFAGFPSWDQRWIQSSGYAALNIGSSAQRAFGTMSSGQDYAAFLGLSLVAWVSLLGKKTRLPMVIHLACIALVAVAIFYESERTVVFLAVMALGALAAARRGARPMAVVAAGAIAVVLLVVGASALGGDSSQSAYDATSNSGALANHQLQGLTNPTGSTSSFSGHLHHTQRGIMAGFTHPLGNGTGSVTLAARRYNVAGHNINGSTEFDPGNMGVAFGIIGVGLYVAVLLLGIGTAYRTAVKRRDAVGFMTLGALLVALLQWFNGDLYSTTWLVWLFLGFADGFLLRGNDSVEVRLLRNEPEPLKLPPTQGRWIQRPT